LQGEQASKRQLRQQIKARDEELSRLYRLTADLAEANLAYQRRQQAADNEVLRLKADIVRLNDQLVEARSANQQHVLNPTEDSKCLDFM
jgi:uncharacterized protein with PhoU and TrkA domain